MSFIKESPLEDLRKKLEEAKRLLGDIVVPNPKKLKENCEKFIVLRQEIQELVDYLRNLKVPIEPELVRLQEIDALVKSNISILNRGLKNSSIFLKASYPIDFWWWHIPEIVEKDRKRKLRKILTVSIISGLVILALVLFFTFYKTSEEIVVEAFSKIDRLIKEEKFDLAEKELLNLLEKFPDNPEIWIKLGILQEMVKSSKASYSFEKAKNLYKNEEEFCLKRAQMYFQEKMLDKAENDIKEILKKNDENPQALYLLGSIYEEKGKLIEAISVYRKIESLGDKVDPQLMAMTKVRLVMLLQKVPVVLPLK